MASVDIKAARAYARAAASEAGTPETWERAEAAFAQHCFDQGRASVLTEDALITIERAARLLMQSGPNEAECLKTVDKLRALAGKATP